MQLIKILGCALLMLTAQAAGARDISSDYGAILGKYVYPDESRDAYYGAGAHLIYGIPLTEQLDLEFNGQGYLIERDSRVNKDYTYGAGLDLRYVLADSTGFGLFFLFGAGALYEDVMNDTGVSPYLNTGFSVNFWEFLGVPNLSVRSDLRFYGVDRKDSSGFNSAAMSNENFGDGHFNIGFQLDFAEDAPPVALISDTDGDGVIDTSDACPATPAGSAVDGSGCPLPGDADGDTINDTLDKCPDTAPGVLVDASGCPIATAPMPLPMPQAAPAVDSDGDGVLDQFDACPSTPPGFPVDTRGCPVSRDLDGDGVFNQDDACPNTPRTMRVDASGCVVRQVVGFNNITFKFNSDELTGPAQEILNGIANGLRGQPGMEVQVHGHTDAIGSTAYNQELSENRARAVKAYLMRQGILAPRMKTSGFGESKPVASNETDAGRAQNRRVEFKVLRQ